MNTKSATAEISEFFNFPYFKYNLVLWLIFSLTMLVLYSVRRSRLKVSYIQYLFGLGIISTGFVIGVIMGNNRNPIGDAIMSATIALLGTIIAYLFVKNEDIKDQKSANHIKVIFSNSEKNQFIAAIFLILFPISLLYGAHLGAGFRMKNELLQEDSRLSIKVRLDSAELWKKSKELELQRTAEFDRAMLETWKENEKKRYETLLKLHKNGPLPEVEDYMAEDPVPTSP